MPSSALTRDRLATLPVLTSLIDGFADVDFTVVVFAFAAPLCFVRADVDAVRMLISDTGLLRCSLATFFDFSHSGVGLETGRNSEPCAQD